MSARPFQVLGIQQIAIGAPDKQRLKTLWVDMLGLEVTGNFRSERENVDEDICAIGSGPFKVEVDLMQPIDPEKKPAVHTTPLNHVGLWIDDLPAAVQWLSARGVRFAPGGIRKGAAGFDVCFLHPKSNEEFPVSGEGVLIELVQAPPEVVSAFARMALLRFALARARHGCFNKRFFARQFVRVGDAGVRCHIGQFVLRLRRFAAAVRSQRVGTPGCGGCVARAGQIGLRRRPGGPAGGRVAGIF